MNLLIRCFLQGRAKACHLSHGGQYEHFHFGYKKTRHHANMFMKFRPPTQTPLLYGKTGVCEGIFLYVFLSVFFPFYIALHQIWPTLHPKTIFMDAKLFIGVPLMWNKVVIKNKPVWALWKCGVSMATRDAILKNWGVPAKPLVSQLLLIIHY